MQQINLDKALMYLKDSVEDFGHQWKLAQEAHGKNEYPDNLTPDGWHDQFLLWDGDLDNRLRINDREGIKKRHVAHDLRQQKISQASKSNQLPFTATTAVLFFSFLAVLAGYSFKSGLFILVPAIICWGLLARQILASIWKR